MKAIIPLAGRGTRMYPLSVNKPKELTKILNKPVLSWGFDMLIKNKISEYVVIIDRGPKSEMIRKFISSNYPNISVKYVVQERLLGTGHALQEASSTFSEKDDILYIMPDDIYAPEDVARLIKSGYGLLAKEVEDPEKWGIIELNKDGSISKIVEKPKKPKSNLANVGCYYLPGKIKEYLAQLKRSVRDELEVTDAITMLAKDQPLKAIKMQGYWHPIGYPWHVLSATNNLIGSIKNSIKGEIMNNVSINGTVVLPKSSKIKPNCYIEGNLIVGENTTIGPNVIIEGNVVIGNNCVIEDFSRIKNSSIEDNCVISGSNIASSIFGSNINFPLSVAGSFEGSFYPDKHDWEANSEIKTLVKNNYINTSFRKFGAVVGDNCKFGVHTLIFPGVKVWPNSKTSPRENIKHDRIDLWE